MNFLSGFCIAVMLLLAAGACTPVPSTDHPLGPPGAAADDPALAGVWHGLNPEGSHVYVEAHALEGGGYNVIGIITNGRDEDLPLIFSHYRAHATELDGRLYYNLLTLVGWPNDIWTAFGDANVIVRYDFVGDGLFLELMQPDLIEAAVKDGRLAGTIDDDGFIRLTGDPDDLAAFIREIGADKVFALRFGPLHRLDDSLPPFDIDYGAPQ